MVRRKVVREQRDGTCRLGDGLEDAEEWAYEEYMEQ